MNVRCAFCQTPYTLSRVTMLDALQEMDSKKLNHYDAHCPRCRRATQIPRQRMEMFFPNWRDALKEFEVEMRKHPQQEAPAPVADAHQSTPVAEAESTPKPKATKEKPVAKPKPAAAKATSPSSQKTKKTTAAPQEKKITKKSK
jgi:hypothetical protein